MERNEITDCNKVNSALLDAESCLSSERSKSTRNLNASDLSTYGYPQPRPSWFKKNWKKVVLCVLGTLVLTILVGAITWAIVYYINLPPNRDRGVPEKYNFDKCSFYQTIYSRSNEHLNDDDDPSLVRIVYKIENNISYESTGSLIADDVILTSGHGIFEMEDIKMLELHIGGTAAKNYTDMIIIPRSEFDPTIHPDFHFDNNENIKDIGFFKLKNKLKFSKAIHPICLPIGEDKLPDKLTMNVWTSRKLNDLSTAGKKLDLVNSDDCHESYITKGDNRDLKFYKDKKQIIFCANTADYIPKGNSGATAKVKHGNVAIARGILSMGGSKNSSLPSVFVDVQANLEWIFNNT